MRQKWAASSSEALPAVFPLIVRSSCVCKRHVCSTRNANDLPVCILFLQVFEVSSKVLDVTLGCTINESMSSSVPKRRRVVGGIEAVIEILSTPGKTQDIWPW
jgi:hypothetical protein